MQSILLELAPVERRAVVDLLSDELARGCHPQRTEIEAALAVVRGRSVQDS